MKRWIKKLKEMAGYRKPNAALSLPTAPPSQEASAPSSPEYSREALNEALTKALQEQFGRDVKIHWVGPKGPPSAPSPVSPPAAAKASTGATVHSQLQDRPGTIEQGVDHLGPYEAKRDRNARLRAFTRTARLKEVFGKPIAETKLWIYDPQADEPLDKDSEEFMFEQIEEFGHEPYLRTLCERHGINPEPFPATPHECVRATRKLVRSLKIYEGEKFIQ